MFFAEYIYSCIFRGEKYHISKHLKSTKHKKAFAASANSLTKFVNNVSNQLQELPVVKDIFTYHRVQHFQSFREMDGSQNS